MASISSTVTSWSMTEYMAVWLVYDTKNHSKKSVWHYTWLRVWHKTWVQFFGKKGKKRVYDTKVYDTKCTTSRTYWPLHLLWNNRKRRRGPKLLCELAGRGGGAVEEGLYLTSCYPRSSTETWGYRSETPLILKLRPYSICQGAICYVSLSG